MDRSKLFRAFVGAGLMLGIGVVMAVPASALTIPGSSPPATFVPITTSGSQVAICSGTDAAPGQLAGTYPAGVAIVGTCWVNGGVAQVNGDVTILAGSSLNATFGLNDQAHGVGQSALYVTGNIDVDAGGTLLLGCEANHEPCTDDPAAATGGTLTTLDIVAGSILASDALGVVVHHSIVGGNVEQVGGGGGLTCAPPTSGVFASMHSPVFSDYEDNWIVGSLTIAGLQTCWDGSLRNYVGGDMSSNSNVFADPDANEDLSNVIAGDLTCVDNSPIVQYGDSHASPNKVGETATGECAFGVLQPDPPGPPMPVAVPG